MAMKVELVSPERVLWSGEATQVVGRTLDGDIAFLPGHAPFIGALDIAPLRIWPVGHDEHSGVKAAVHGGFVEVSDDVVTILSDVAELAEDIDLERAKSAYEKAGEILATNHADAEALAALKRAQTRLGVLDYAYAP